MEGHVLFPKYKGWAGELACIAIPPAHPLLKKCSLTKIVAALLLLVYRVENYFLKAIYSPQLLFRS